MKFTFILLFLFHMSVACQTVTEYIQLADDAMKFDQPATAVLYYTSALKLSDHDIKSLYLKRGIAYARNNEFQPAISDYNKAIQLDGNFAQAYYYRSVAKGLSGLQEQAITDFEYSVKLDSVLISSEISKDDKRENFRATEIKQMFKNNFIQDALVLMLNNNYCNALKKYTFILLLNPTDSEAFALRGAAYSKLGEHSNAIIDFTNALNYNPNDPEIFYQRGIEKQAAGDLKGACKDWESAVNNGNLRAKDLISKYCN